MVVAVGVFQTPVFRAGGGGPYPLLHPEAMTAADAALLAQLPPGKVLAPAPMADIIVLERGNPVVFGLGSFNLTEVAYTVLRGEVEAVWAGDLAAFGRVLGAYEPRWVYCPDTWPCGAAVVAMLDGHAGARLVGSSGAGRLYALSD